jgi:hypothetical protein
VVELSVRRRPLWNAVNNLACTVLVSFKVANDVVVQLELLPAGIKGLARANRIILTALDEVTDVLGGGRKERSVGDNKT